MLQKNILIAVTILSLAVGALALHKTYAIRSDYRSLQAQVADLDRGVRSENKDDDFVSHAEMLGMIVGFLNEKYPSETSAKPKP
jgi:hypothetical protein